MNVYITKSSGFLPGDPVANEDIESYLGMVNGKPSRARAVILRHNGIKQRYYALDRDGRVTHTNVEMAANAVRGLFDQDFQMDDLDVLACGTASPEQILPSHGVQVHGALGGQRSAEVVSFAGSCCSGMDALKYAAMSVELEPAKRAVAVASERTSAWMRAAYFQQETDRLALLDEHAMLAFEKEFLRWMLSDGAFAVLVQGEPSATRVSLRLDWIEITSFANSMETCMYAGGEKDKDGNLRGWTLFPQQKWLTRSLFALKQDTRLLARHIVPLGVDYLAQLAEQRHFTPDDVDWFLPHLSSMFFKGKILEGMGRFPIPEKKWFYNLPRVGNIGSASAFAMLDELMRSGQLRSGQHILMMVPESARFSYCYCMLTVA